MGAYSRKEIIGTSPLDLKNINDNFKWLWLKTFGNMTDDDIANDANINGAKIKADSITAKQIAANTITANEIDVTTLYVGTGGITLDSTAIISWSQIIEEPTFALQSELSNYATSGELNFAMQNLLVSSNLQTILGIDYVITGLVAANKIAAGLITGCTLQTASDNANTVSISQQWVECKKGGYSALQLGYYDQSGVIMPMLAFGNPFTGISYTGGKMYITNNGGDINMYSLGGSVNLSGTVKVNNYNVLTTNTPIVARFA